MSVNLVGFRVCNNQKMFHQFLLRIPSTLTACNCTVKLWKRPNLDSLVSNHYPGSLLHYLLLINQCSQQGVSSSFPMKYGLIGVPNLHAINGKKSPNIILPFGKSLIKVINRTSSSRIFNNSVSKQTNRNGISRFLLDIKFHRSGMLFSLISCVFNSAISSL